MEIVDPCVPLHLVPPGSRAQIIGKDQQEYRDLPAIRTPLGHVITRWTLTDQPGVSLRRRVRLDWTNGSHMRIEVRCCCQPQKLLGWLPLSADVSAVHAGQIIHFLVSAARWELASHDGTPSFKPADIISLPVERLGTTNPDGERITRLALKSEETPIERLRLIPGFVENSRP